ncbi:MAG: mismatch-specific DNA-glycosylase [Solirubrobacteraceae bacterium]|nr:mismatch-specific DNA-glycosylase [Solirubrobacteraceae bacterium]
MTILPDVLAPGLRVVFCGSAAGAVSAQRGAPYAGPGNKFWPMLFETGLTPRLFAPEEFRDLLALGIGITDLNKTTSGSDAEIGTAADDLPRLQRVIAGCAPEVIAFVGMRAGKAALGTVAGYGPQPIRFAGAEAWVLPSTSGLAVRWWTPEPWFALASRCGGSSRPRGTTAPAPAGC